MVPLAQSTCRGVSPSIQPLHGSSAQGANRRYTVFVILTLSNTDVTNGPHKRILVHLQRRTRGKADGGATTRAKVAYGSRKVRLVRVYPDAHAVAWNAFVEVVCVVQAGKQEDASARNESKGGVFGRGSHRVVFGRLKHDQHEIPSQHFVIDAKPEHRAERSPLKSTFGQTQQRIHVLHGTLRPMHHVGRVVHAHRKHTYFALVRLRCIGV